AISRAWVGGTGLVLPLPVIVDLLPATLQLLEGGPVSLLAFAVLLDGTVVGFEPGFPSLLPRALERAGERFPCGHGRTSVLDRQHHSGGAAGGCRRAVGRSQPSCKPRVDNAPAMGFNNHIVPYRT